jgi:hypothetical protein
MEVQAIGIEPPLELQHYDKVKAEKKASSWTPHWSWYQCRLLRCAQEEKKGASQHVPISKTVVGCLPPTQPVFMIDSQLVTRMNVILRL